MKFNLGDVEPKPEPAPELKVIDGNFYEGEFVTVSINDDVIRRKVYYSGTAGDLYIRYKNRMYFKYEFK